jgi:DNA-binding response OmpR family regulator
VDLIPGEKENILVVDDDKDILGFLKVYIESAGYRFYSADNTKDALHIVESHSVDLIILDVLLPQTSGFDICLELRKRTRIPIIFLSCKNEEMDIIMGLSSGADDYITKPFLPGELMARIRSNLRRTIDYDGGGSGHIVSYRDIEANLFTREASVGKIPVRLLPKEFDILVLFLRHPNRVFSKDEICLYIWKESVYFGDINTLSVHISNLRKKLSVGNDTRIMTVKGIGYKLTGGA